MSNEVKGRNDLFTFGAGFITRLRQANGMLSTPTGGRVWLSTCVRVHLLSTSISSYIVGYIWYCFRYCTGIGHDFWPHLLSPRHNESTNRIIWHTVKCCRRCHYGDDIMGTMTSQITNLTIVYSIVYSDADQRNIKAPRLWPLCREITGDRWIPRTNGQLRGNVSIWWRHHGYRFIHISI